MSRKNFKADTAQKGQTPKTENKHPFVYKNLNTVENTNVPTGKVVTLEDKKKRKEEREKQYIAFRTKALMRRAKRMKLSEEDTKKAIDKLLAQIREPNTYTILLMYTGAIRDNNGKMNPINKMVEEIIINNNMKWLMKSDYHMYIEGDQNTLGKLREILPDGVQVYPHVKKKPAILPVEEPPKSKKPRNKIARKDALKKKKLEKIKQSVIANKNRKKRAGKAYAKLQKQIRLQVKKKTKKAIAVKMTNKNASVSVKKAA